MTRFPLADAAGSLNRVALGDSGARVMDAGETRVARSVLRCGVWPCLEWVLDLSHVDAPSGCRSGRYGTAHAVPACAHASGPQAGPAPAGVQRSSGKLDDSEEPNPLGPRAAARRGGRGTAAGRAAMAAFGGKLVLFGGLGNSALYNDTWFWDGESWTQANAYGPSSRWESAMATYSE